MSAKQSERITSYNDFWLHYLREHSLPETRALHYIGTLAGILIWIYSLYTLSFKLAPLGLVAGQPVYTLEKRLFGITLTGSTCGAGYFAAWVAHFFIEHNKPATFKYPGWSFISDFKMLSHFLTGTLQPHLQKAGVRRSQAPAAKRH